MKQTIEQREQESGHSVYGPSQLPRILRCPGSVKEALKVPLEPTSIYAEHGTLLHDVIANATLKDNPELYVKRRMDIDEDDRNAVNDAIDYLESVRRDCSAEVKIETEVVVNLKSWGEPRVWGTVDKSLMDVRSATCHTLDWKFGKGVQVYAEENEQCLAYAAGAIGFPSQVERVVVHIVQPFLNHYDEWETTYKYLREWVNDVLIPGLDKTEVADPALVPGEKQCKFCPAKVYCVARYRQNLGNAEAVFAAFKKPETIGPKQWGEILNKAKEWEQYVKDIRTHVYAELEKGRPVPGWKMVSGRSTRKFHNERAAFKWLRDFAGMTNQQLYVPKPLSVAQVEKKNRSLKKDPDFQALINKPPGGPQLVSSDDPRPEITLKGDPANAFAKFKEK